MAPRRPDDALGLPRRPRRVQNVQWVVGVDGDAVVRHGALHAAVPVDVPAVLKLGRSKVGAVVYDRVLDPGAGQSDGVVDDRLEVKDLGPLDSAVHSDHDLSSNNDTFFIASEAYPTIHHVHDSFPIYVMCSMF